MSTIASPRPSLNVQSPTSPSTRSSLSVESGAPPTTADTQALPQKQRRNRTALRDYYGLSTFPAPSTQPSSQQASSQSATPQSSSPPTSPSTATHLAPLDDPDFSPEDYISSLLSTSPLANVLRVESDLISEVRSLDGEKKALVYDNYSKLIAATETIRKMRESMEPLAPMTGELGPGVEKIVGVAGSVGEGLKGRRELDEQQKRKSEGDGEVSSDESDERGASKSDVETVKWVLGAPRRLERLLQEDKREVAEKDWEEIKGLLEKWHAVGGVDEVKSECEMVMKG